MIAAFVTGVMAWEMLNPVTVLHRGLVYGLSYTWTVALAIFIYAAGWGVRLGMAFQ